MHAFLLGECRLNLVAYLATILQRKNMYSPLASSVFKIHDDGGGARSLKNAPAVQGKRIVIKENMNKKYLILQW